MHADFCNLPTLLTDLLKRRTASSSKSFSKGVQFKIGHNDANTFSPELNTLGDRGDYPISSWTHYGTFNYSTKIKKYTVAAVTAVISGIVGASTMGAGAAATISSTTGLIAYIVDNQIEDIWYTDFVYYKTLLPPDPKMFRMKVAEKTVHYFYSDSNRDNLMKGSPITSEFWLDGYKKN